MSVKCHGTKALHVTYWGCVTKHFSTMLSAKTNIKLNCLDKQFCVRHIIYLVTGFSLQFH